METYDWETDDMGKIYEHNLPGYLQDDLDAYKEGAASGNCTHMDCLWCELYGSINSAMTGGEIAPDHADYLREKFLGL